MNVRNEAWKVFGLVFNNKTVRYFFKSFSKPRNGVSGGNGFQKLPVKGLVLTGL